MDNQTEEVPKVYKAEKRRFMVIISTCILSISNSTIWMTYAPISTIAANYFEVNTSAMNWFTQVFYLIVIPMMVVSSYILNRFGLKWAIQLGSFFNCSGAILRVIATSGAIADRQSQYSLALFGQILGAVAQSFIMLLPAKLSQVWFPEHQRGLATTVVSIGYTLGMVVAQSAVPFIVNDTEDIMKNNIIWMVFAIIAEILVIIFIRSGKPNEPPSRSAEQGESLKAPYGQQLKEAVTNPTFILLFICIGGCVGCFTSTSSLAQQMLCPLGYSKEYSGLMVAGTIFSGFFGAALFGRILDRTKEFVIIVKFCFGIAALFFIVMLELFLWPNMHIGIAISGVLFGFFAFGGYPTLFELAVEITYPIEESVSSGFLFLSAQINGAALVALVPITATSQKQEYRNLNVCTGSSLLEPKDYTIAVIILITYFSSAITIFVLFLKTRFKRQEAEAAKTTTEKPQYLNKGFVDDSILNA